MTQNFAGRVLKRHPDAAFQVVDGKAMIVVPTTKSVHVVNEIGTRIWDLIDGARNVSEILDEIAKDYQVERPQLEADLREFVDTLDGNGMLLQGEE